MLPVDPQWVLDHMPAAVLVVDRAGNVIAGSARAAALVDRTLDEFVGSSMLAYVDLEAVWAYAAAMGTTVDKLRQGLFGGPIRLAVHGRDGRSVACELWGARAEDVDGQEQTVLLLTRLSASHGLAEALGVAGAGGAFTEVAQAVVAALGGHPVVADAALYLPDRGIVNSTAAPGVFDVPADTCPWRLVAATGQRRVLATAADAPAELAAAMTEAGYRALWIEPVARAGGPGAIMVLRPISGEPTSNELAHLHQAATLIALTGPS